MDWNSVITAIQNPSHAIWSFRVRVVNDLKPMWRMLRNGRWYAFSGYLGDYFFNKNFYLRDRVDDAEEGTLEIDVLGFKMLVDVDNGGISHELITHHIWEPVTTQVYRSELVSLRETKSDIVVLDVGSNIGYYALLAADILGDSGTIYAIEPVPTNVDLLKKNIELNGFSNFEVTRSAVGAVTGSAELALATRSNRHRIKNSDTSEFGTATSETIETPICTIDDFIESNGIAPEDVDVIRMDVEGFETEIFKGMSKVLNADSSLLINMELHPGELDTSEIENIINVLNEGGFEIVSVSNDYIGTAISDFESLKKFPAYWYELIVKR